MVSRPLEDLWSPNGTDLGAQRIRSGIGADHIKELLRAGRVRFAVIDKGTQLRWVDGSERYGVWKAELQPHLYEPTRPYLEDYPDEYFYDASEWQLPDGTPVVLFTMRH